VALTGTGQSRHALSSTSQLLESLLYAFFRVIPRRLEFICRRFGTLCLLRNMDARICSVCIFADVGLATVRSPFIWFLTNLPNIYTISTKSIPTEDMHTEKQLKQRVLRKVWNCNFALHIGVFVNFQALCDVKSCRLANNCRIFGENFFDVFREKKLFDYSDMKMGAMCSYKRL
jgi:hypothetical protein